MNTLARTHVFGSEWFRGPLRVGAISPSGQSLAVNITDGLNKESGPILELGPGTGVFTQAMMIRGIEPSEVTAVELGTGFVEVMRKSFPDITLIQGDASRMQSLLKKDDRKFSHIICGLPLLSMPQRDVYRILSSSFGHLEPGGSFRLFTYGWRCPVPSDVLKRLALHAEHKSLTLRNIPPASVYSLTKYR